MVISILSNSNLRKRQYRILKAVSYIMRILVLTASTGGGHKSAAAALKNTIEKNDPSAKVEICDAIQYCGKLYNRFICSGYVVLATKTPKLYGKLYDISDRESKINNLCNHLNSLEGKKLLSLFENFNPDVVISCHAFVTTMLAGLKYKNRVSFPVISLITDFCPHKTYFFPEIEAYVTPTDQMVDEITEQNGIERSRLYPLGIPIADKFYAQSDRSKTARELGFETNKQTVLLMAGSFGVSEVLNFFESLDKSDRDCQCIIITGKNHKLCRAFQEYLSNKEIPHKKSKLFEFVDNVEEYMHFADLAVTKPGGLTVTESLACRLPMALYSAFPGQESENAKFLQKTGAAVLLDKDPDKGGKSIAQLLADSEKLEAMKKNCEKISKKNSALNIYRLAQRLASNS